MPYCEDCAKYWTPSSMNVDGTCPTCGRVVDEPAVASTVTAANLSARDIKRMAAGDDDDAGAPWHFKVMMVLLVAYLGWRVLQLFGIG
jgi:hypothetical protein